MSLSANKYAIFLLSCSLIVFGFPGQSVGICAVTDEIITTTGLSRNMFSAIYSCATITGCFMILASGVAIDKLGFRKVTLLVLTVWTILFFTIGNVFVVYERFAIQLCNQALYFTFFLYISLSLLRFLGQNMLPVLGRVKMAKTFNKHHGILFSLIGIFVSISTGLAPRIMRFLSKNGWHCAYKNLSVVALAFLIVYFLFFRESKGKAQLLKLHSNKIKNIKISEKSNVIEEVISRSKLIKMPNFWYITIPLCLNSFIGSGLTVHIMDIFREGQAESDMAISHYLYMSYSTIFSSVVFGKLVDKNKIWHSVVLMLVLQFFGLIGLEFSRNIIGLSLYVICIGGSWGAYGVMIATVYGKLFGKRNLGAIMGLVQFFSSTVGAISVFLMSFFKCLLGSYFHLLHLIECIIVFVTILAVKNLSVSNNAQDHKLQ